MWMVSKQNNQFFHREDLCSHLIPILHTLTTYDPKKERKANIIFYNSSTLDSAHDPESPYFDSKSTPAAPKWSMVHVEFRKRFKEIITLKDLNSYKQPGGVLADMQALKQSRLSVSKVTKEEWDFIIGLAEEQEAEEQEAKEETEEKEAKEQEV